MSRGYIYIVITAFLFSTAEISGKLISNEINPYQLTFIRFLIGALILLPFAVKEIRKRKIMFDKKEFLYFIFQGFLCVVVSMSLFQLAVLYTKASTVAIVFSVNPIFTIPFAYFILSEKINRNTILSLVISILGLIFILNPANMELNKDFKGIVLALLSAVVFSLYSVIGKKKIDKYGGIAFNCITFILGDLILLVILLFLKIPIIQGVEKSNVIQILYMGIFVTGLGYLFYFLSMEKVSATMTSVVFFIKPALAPILAFIILGERIKFSAMIGIACILIGSYIMLISKKNKLINKEEAFH